MKNNKSRLPVVSKYHLSSNCAGIHDEPYNIICYIKGCILLSRKLADLSNETFKMRDKISGKKYRFVAFRITTRVVGRLDFFPHLCIESKMIGFLSVSITLLLNKVKQGMLWSRFWDNIIPIALLEHWNILLYEDLPLSLNAVLTNATVIYNRRRCSCKGGSYLFYMSKDSHPCQEVHEYPLFTPYFGVFTYHKCHITFREHFICKVHMIFKPN